MAFNNYSTDIVPRLNFSNMNTCPTLQEKRVACHAQFEDAIVKLKSSKDLAAFQTTTKKLAADHKNETQAISDLATSLKGTDAAEKIAELQKQDR